MPLRKQDVVRRKDGTNDCGKQSSGDSGKEGICEGHGGQSNREGRYQNLALHRASANDVDKECEQAREITLMGVDVGMSHRVRTEGLIGESVGLRDTEVVHIRRMP